MPDEAISTEAAEPSAVDDDRDAEHGAMRRPGATVEPSGGVFGPMARLIAVTAALGLLVTALTAGWAWARLPAEHVRVHPGPLFELDDELAAVAADPGFGGGWHVTTITVEQMSRLAYARAVLAGDDDDLEPVDRDRQADIRVGSQLSMAHTRRVAAALAAREVAGTPLPEASGMAVVEITPGEAADGAGVVPGDVVLSVDGEAAGLDLLEQAGTGGAELVVSGNGIGEPRAVRLEPGPVGLRALPRLPAGPIDTALSDVTGGSAGVLLTLALVDATSPGDLTGGLVIAGTGAIDGYGNAVAVVGTDQKARAAADGGADVFLHPVGEAPRDAAGLQLVAIGDVGDAIDWLCANGATDEVCRGR